MVSRIQDFTKGFLKMNELCLKVGWKSQGLVSLGLEGEVLCCLHSTWGLYNWTVHTAGHCPLYIVSCFLLTVHCLLYLFTVHRVLYTVHCILYTLHCILYTVHCILYTVHCILYTLHCTLLDTNEAIPRRLRRNT